MIKEDLKIRGDLTISLYGEDGFVKDTRKLKNLVVDGGLDFVVSRMKDATAQVMTHMAVGSGSTAAASNQTNLFTTLGNREALDSTTVSGSTITYTASFEAGDGTGAITEAGVFSASTGGAMLCRTVFPPVNKQAADAMTITWSLNLLAG